MLSVIWKELKVLFSKRISLLVLLVYPLLLVYLLGVGFAPNASNFNVAISDINDFNKLELQNSFSLFNVNPVFVEDSNTNRNGVSLFFDNVFNISPIFVSIVPLQLGTYAVNILYEDLDFFVGTGGLQLTQNSIMNLSTKISLEKITKITDEIKSLREILILQKEKLQNYSLMLEDSEKQLKEVKVKLQSVNFAEIKSTLDAKQQDLNEINAKMLDLKDDKEVLDNAYSSNKEVVDLLDSLYGSLNKFNLDLTQIQSDALFLSVLLTQLQDANFDINAVDLESFLSSAEILSNDLNVIMVLLEDTNNAANNSSLGLGKFINDFNSTFNLIENDINDTNVLLENLNIKLDEMESDFNYVNSVVDDSLVKQSQIKDDLNKSIVLLDSLIIELDPAKFDPEPIAKPITITTESHYPFFAKRDVSIIFGIVLVLLFNAILLISMAGVKDKTQAIDVREKLSPRNRFWFLFGRFCAQSIVGVLTCILMFLFAYFVFGFPLQNLGLLVLFTLIAIFAFVAIGLFISLFVNNESVAILLSLLIVLPMLFLSGLILPTYFMPPLLNQIANLLPLTLAKNAIINAIVGKSAVYYGLILAGFAVVFLGLTYFFRKR